MNPLGNLKFWLLVLTLFTLPMYMKANNIILGLFVVVGILDNLKNRRYRDLRTTLTQGIPILAFFLLAALGAFRSFSLDGFSHIEKYWSFLLLPLTLIPDYKSFADRYRPAFLALAWGCTTTLLICYANTFWEMIIGAEPMSYLFRWRHLGHQFTEIADTHPTYLAVFIVVSIFFLIQDSKTSNGLKSILIPFLVLGLFQLASRIALFLLILLVIFILVRRFRGNKWQTASVVFGVVFGSLLVIYYGSEYLTSRIFSENAIVNDRRMIRWEVSYEIFRENPLVGVGYDRIKPMRRDGYLRHEFEVGALEEYNAHNQLLEFLSTQGAIGGFVYVTSLSYLFLLAIYRRQTLFAFVIFAFFVACSTESMLVRIKGVEYLAIFGTLLLCVINSSKPQDEDFYNT